MKTQWPDVSLGELLRLERRPVEVLPNAHYQEIGIYCFGRGIFRKEPRTGLEVGDKALYLLREGDFILQVTFAWEGAIAIVSSGEDGLYGSTRFPTFRVDESRCIPRFLLLFFKTNRGLQQLVRICPGSAGRNRVLSVRRIPEVLVPLPPVEEQRRIVVRIEELAGQIAEAGSLRRQASEEAKAVMIGARTHYYDHAATVYGTRRLGDICRQITDGTHQTPRYIESGVPFLSVKDITTGQIRFDACRRISLEEHAELTKRCKPELGDVLLTKVGTTGFFGARQN